MLEPLSMIVAPSVLLLLAVGEPPRAEASAVQAELDSCAARIETLKSRRQVGRELDRLLRRAEELAGELDRARAELPSAPAAPSPEELRERADAARDEVDRLAAEIAVLDVKLQDARRSRTEPGDPVARASLGGTPSGGERIRALAAERAALAERRARAEAEAHRLDREAHAAEIGGP